MERWTNTTQSTETRRQQRSTQCHFKSDDESDDDIDDTQVILSDPCYSRCVMALQSVTPRPSTGSISDVILTQTALTRQHCSPLTGSRQQTQIKRGERGETIPASQCRMSDLNTPHPDTYSGSLWGDMYGGGEILEKSKRDKFLHIYNVEESRV